MLIELAHLLQTIDFFAYLHFIKRFIPSFIFAFLSLTETKLPDATKDAALLDATRKTPDKTFGSFPFLTFYLYHIPNLLSLEGDPRVPRKALVDARAHVSRPGKHAPKNTRTHYVFTGWIFSERRAPPNRCR